jgi:transposase
VDLTDAQWALIAPLLPKYRRRKDGRGRPRQDLRAVLNGTFWILRMGARWAELPDRYPPYQTCHRYFQERSQAGTWSGFWRFWRRISTSGAGST